MASNAPSLSVRLRLTDKLLMAAAFAVAAAIFLSIGWMAIAPDDPYGAVSLIAHHHPAVMVLESVALAAVTAAIATIMIGVKIADVGVFATALGLGLVSVRGQTAGYLLMQLHAGHPAGESVLAGKLAAEAIVWFVVLLAAALVSGLVMHWCYDGAHSQEAISGTGRRVHATDLAIAECPALRAVAGASPPSDRRAGLGFAVVAAVVAALVFALFVAGSEPREIRHGQICFATLAAFYLGVWAAKSFFMVRTAFWGLLAVPLAYLLGFVWTVCQGVGTSPYDRFPAIPSSNYLRALPLTYISVGAIGALLAHWTIAQAPRRNTRDRATSDSRKR